MARCGCGDNSPSSIRTLFSANNGVQYNAATGNFSADISPNAGNTLSLVGGKLYSAANTTVGLSGDGTSGNPIRANVSAWPYPTAPTTGAQGIFVNGSDVLVSPPVQIWDMTQQIFNRTYANLPVAAGAVPVTADSFTTTLTNPDPNRTCLAIVWREVDVRFTMPGTGTGGPSSAGYSFASDDPFKLDNQAAATMANIGTQTVKFFRFGTIPPAGSTSYTLDVGTLNGAGGATYSRIKVTIRAIYLGQ